MHNIFSVWKHTTKEHAKEKELALGFVCLLKIFSDFETEII